MGGLGSIPRSRRSPGEGNGNPLQYSCLENSMDGGTWWAIVHGVAKSQTRLSDFTSLHANDSKGVGPGWEGGASGGLPCTAPSTGGKGLLRPCCWLQGQGQAFKLTLTSQESSANPAKAKYLEEYLSFSGVLANLLSQSISE